MLHLTLRIPSDAGPRQQLPSGAVAAGMPATEPKPALVRKHAPAMRSSPAAVTSSLTASPQKVLQEGLVEHRVTVW